MNNSINHKIKSLDDVSKIVADLKKEGKKVVQCHGVFDLVHPGHIFHFEAAKKEGDILIVSITVDKFVNKGPNRPIFPTEIRAKSLASLEIVDFVVINEDFTVVNLLKKIKPNVYFKGEEYELALKDRNRNFYKEVEAVKSVGGDVKFSYGSTFSSSNFLKNYFDIYPSETKNFLEAFVSKYSEKEIINDLKSLQDLKVLVIGESIIDEYCYCRGIGKTPKDNLVATKFLSSEIFAGGVLACANHLASFCKSVDLITVLGEKNNYEDFIKSNLKKNIEAQIFYQDKGQTILKRRFIDPTFFNKMFEIYYFDDKNLSEEISERILDFLDNNLSKYDLVVVNDYGHGFFNKKIIEKLVKKAKFLAVNAQTNSANIGFNLITKYPKADYICIDEPEARLATGQKDADIEEVVSQIFKKIDVKKLVITRGHLGSISCENNSNIYNTPVLSTKIVDRVGAGDAFLAISSLCASKKMPIEVVGFIGNVAGAIKVTIVGNKFSITLDQVNRFIKTLFK